MQIIYQPSNPDNKSIRHIQQLLSSAKPSQYTQTLSEFGFPMENFRHQGQQLFVCTSRFCHRGASAKQILERDDWFGKVAVQNQLADIDNDI